MKTFKHDMRVLIKYRHPVLEHKEVCIGLMNCPICGRKVCSGCVISESTARRDTRFKDVVGQCMICSGKYEYGTIRLYLSPNEEEVNL